jgi:predicted ATPase/class 3 adenylate cyclase/DNA-binding CsgD family transcriptional regulator
MADRPTGTVTFLFTDIEGSTRLWEQYPQAMPGALARHDAIMREAIASEAGVVYKVIGDAFQAAFATAPAACAAALAAQRALASEAWGAVGAVPVRMALHTCAILPSDGEYRTGALNRLGRLLGAVHGGQIVLSRSTADLARESLPPGVMLRDLGERHLRDLRPEPVFQLIGPGLAIDFPPLKTLDRPRHNLPPQPTALIGREWELKNVSVLLDRPNVRLVTLTGPGGTGKTRLALQAAAELLDQFRDGVFFITLASISDAALVAPALAQALSVKEASDRSIVERIKEYLSDREMLLVLDNFEQVLDAALLVRQLLDSAPELKILVTSRSTLRLAGEHEFAVPPLALPDRAHLPPIERLLHYESIRLFVERTQEIRPSFALDAENAAAVVEVCHRLDGLPLAIELAAARSRLFAPQALLERLRRPLDLLTNGPRDTPMRHQTLRATIDWSYALLTPYEQAIFTQLAVFTSGCTLVAAESVISLPDVPHAGILDELEALLEQHLLQLVELPGEEPRLTMLETIREYALDRLQASSQMPALSRRHAEYYLGLAEQAATKLQGAEQGAWLRRLEADHDNLRAALEWCQQAEPELALRLACALWRFWEMHSHMSAGRAWLRDTLAANSGAPAALRARAHHGAGMLAFMQGDYSAAAMALEVAHAVFIELGDREGLASVACSMGIVAWFQGDQAAALAQLMYSVELYRAIVHTWGTADALHYLGHVVLEQGDTARASEIFAESLELFRITGDQRNIALPLKDLGLIASQQGDYVTARARYEESLALSRAVEDSWHSGDTLQRLGDLARLEGDYTQAAALYTESLELWRQLGNQAGIAEALNLLGEVAHLQRNYAQAKTFYESSLALQRVIGSKRVIAGVLHNLGKVAQHQHDYERASSLYGESLALNREISYVPGLADCLIGLAAVAIAHRQAEHAARLLSAAGPHLGAMRGFMPLADRANYDQTLAEARELLGEHQFARVWEAARGLTLEQAIASALASALAPAQHAKEVAAAHLAETQPAPLANTADLTAREIDVLRLVAQGLTDAQVAERLVISPRTVNAHLRSIYSKLGVTTRTAAAHFAATHQLSWPS